MLGDRVTGNACTWRAPLVTLWDGQQVPSDSEAWRAECEARAVLAVPHEARANMLERIEQKRGAEAKARLKDCMREVEHAFVLDMATRDVRRAYLAKVEHHRGENAREHLELRVKELWNRRRALAA